MVEYYQIILFSYDIMDRIMKIEEKRKVLILTLEFNLTPMFLLLLFFWGKKMLSKSI